MKRPARVRGDIKEDVRNLDPRPVTLAEVVAGWGTSPARRRLLRGFAEWRDQLRRAGVTEAVFWVGGSFLDGDVEAPSDLDVTTLLRPPGRFDDPARVAWREAHAAFFDRETRLAELGVDGRVAELDAPDAFRWAQRCYAAYCSASDGQIQGFVELGLGDADDDAAARRALDGAPAAPEARLVPASESDDPIVRAVVAAFAGQDGVAAVGYGGSRAAGPTALADAWSDWDFLVVVDGVKPFASRRRMALSLPERAIEVSLKSPPGVHLRRIVLVDGRTIDLTFVARADVANPEKAAAVSGMVSRRLRVLADTDGVLADACARMPDAVVPAPPTLSTFAGTVQRLYAFALPVAHSIRRGDLWAAGTTFEAAVKRQGLMTMARWHALALGVEPSRILPVATGRRLDLWAPAPLLAQLAAMSPTFDAPAMASALRAALDVFDQLARETAAKLAFADPSAALARNRALVERALDAG